MREVGVNYSALKAGYGQLCLQVNKLQEAFNVVQTESSNASAAVQQLTEQVNSFQSAIDKMESINATVEEYTKKVDNAVTEVNSAVDSIDEIKDNVQKNTNNISNLNELVNSLDADMDNFDSNLKQLNSRVTKNTNDIQDNVTEIDKLETEVNENTGKIASLQQAYGQNTSDISLLSGKLDAFGDRLANVESGLPADDDLGTRVRKLEQDVGDISTAVDRVPAVIQDVSKLKTGLTELQSTVDTSVRNISTALQNNSNDIVANANNLTAFKKEFDTLNDTVNNNDIGAMALIEKQRQLIVALQVDRSALQNTVADIQNNVADIQNNVSDLQIEMSAVEDIKKDVSTLKSSTEAFNENLTALETKVVNGTFNIRIDYGNRESFTQDNVPFTGIKVDEHTYNCMLEFLIENIQPGAGGSIGYISNYMPIKLNGIPVNNAYGTANIVLYQKTSPLKTWSSLARVTNGGLAFTLNSSDATGTTCDLLISGTFQVKV